MLNKFGVAIAALILLALSSAASVQSSSVNRAGLVIVHGDGRTIKRCVEFSQAQISGLDLLTRSGLDLNVDAGNAIGVAVCRIDNEGCTFPSQPCFCQCQGSPCIYWAYWRLTGGAWKYSNIGASSAIVRNGDVDGWVWGVGTISGATPPPVVTFEQVCAPSTTTPTHTVTRTFTPTVTRTFTAIPLPTNTLPRATATLAPTTRAPSSPTSTHTPLPSPKSTDTPRLVSHLLPTLTKSIIPAATATETRTRIAPSPTSAPIVLLQAPPEEKDDEPSETSARSTDRDDAGWGGAWRVARLGLMGCGLGSVMLIVAALTFVALKRLA